MNVFQLQERLTDRERFLEDCEVDKARFEAEIQVLRTDIQPGKATVRHGLCAHTEIGIGLDDECASASRAPHDTSGCTYIKY